MEAVGVDRLAALLEHFSITARTFHTGALCGITDLQGEGDTGQLHLISQGTVEIFHGTAPPTRVTEPSLLLYPRPLAHRFVTDSEHGAVFACANLHFDGGPGNPVAMALPDFICLPLPALQATAPLLKLLFEEAFARNCGRQAMLDRLFEAVLIQILRCLMEDGLVQTGMLAGMAHPQLRRALVSIHEHPARDWSLEELADHAGMSRSVFANTFRERVGCTPGLYLQRWRINLAQQAMLRGRALKFVATDVGYSSEAAFSRAFKACTGMSPGQWRMARSKPSPVRA